MSKTTTIVEDDEDKEVGEKLYRGLPGSMFYGKDGAAHQFDVHGELRTTSSLLQKELDKVSDKAGSPIYTKDSPNVTDVERAPARENLSKAQQTIAEMEARRAAGRPA